MITTELLIINNVSKIHNDKFGYQNLKIMRKITVSDTEIPLKWKNDFKQLKNYTRFISKNNFLYSVEPIRLGSDVLP